MPPFGRYELLALLAKGGLAEIWLARQRGLSGFEKLIVVKRLHERLQREPDYVDMFLDEGRINARLQHTNILSVYELGEIDGRYFLTMEYVEGLPLGVLAKKCVERLSDLPIAIAGGLMVQAAHGLHYAHEATTSEGQPMNIVHRDVSPLNLLVSYEGILKIADFGVAKAEGRLTRTKSGVIKGTPTYMSPEQCTGGPLDRRSDVFSLGILLWELLTGRRLFRRERVEETYDAITTGTIPPPSTYRPELPEGLDATVLRALARRPGDRFPTAEAFRKELEAVLHREGLRAEVVDVRAFLTEHFAAERAEQEALLKRVRQGAIDDGQDAVFTSAEHGLDSAAIEPADDLPFQDGDTDRDAARSAEPAAAAAGPAADTLRDKARAKKRTSRRAWVVAAIVLAVVAAAALGLTLGRLSVRHGAPRITR